MNGIAPPAAGTTVDEKTHRGGKNPSIITAILAKFAFALSVAIAQTTLPAGLDSPDSGVVCNLRRAICYDRYGASIGLKESFLGHIVAERLATSLRRSGTDNRSGTAFSPVEGVDCVRRTGPCCLQRHPLADLAAVLYAPTSRPVGQITEMRAIMYGEWD
jgi:hypothetical protein